jgi:copper homeostasis protein
VINGRERNGGHRQSPKDSALLRPMASVEAGTGRTVDAVEVCCETVGSVEAAVAAGATRVEVCAALVEGGVTPSIGLVRFASALIPTFVLIRPRPGDFVYSEAELCVMEEDIQACKAAGATGVVVGALQRDGRVDVAVLGRLVESARPLQVTFHRAVDACSDRMEVLDVCGKLGVNRVLTSGGAGSCVEGGATLTAMVERAAELGGVTVIAGGGLTPENVGSVVASTGVREVHGSGELRVARSPAAGFHPGAQRGKPFPTHTTPQGCPWEDVGPRLRRQSGFVGRRR